MIRYGRQERKSNKLVSLCQTQLLNRIKYSEQISNLESIYNEVNEMTNNMTDDIGEVLTGNAIILFTQRINSLHAMLTAAKCRSKTAWRMINELTKYFIK